MSGLHFGPPCLSMSTDVIAHVPAFIEERPW